MTDKYRPDKFKCTIDVEVSTGDYWVSFNNLVEPGHGLDFDFAKEVLSRVFEDWGVRVNREGMQ